MAHKKVDNAEVLNEAETFGGHPDPIELLSVVRAKERYDGANRHTPSHHNAVTSHAPSGRRGKPEIVLSPHLFCVALTYIQAQWLEAACV